MSEEKKEQTDKKRKSRPKSEVVKSSSVGDSEKAERKKDSTKGDGEKRETKRSHSRKDKSSHISTSSPRSSDKSAALQSEVDNLKNELETNKANHKQSIEQFEQKLFSLQKENEELASKISSKKDDSSSSSSNVDKDSEIQQLKEQLENEKNKASQLEEKNSIIADHEKTTSSLKHEIESLKSDNEQKDKALESEFNKLAQLQTQVKALNERLETIEKENQDLKSRPQTNNLQSSTGNVLSPRGQTAQGNIPAWKQRELEKQKEADEQRERESKMKLQKVQSLRSTKSEIVTEGNPNFKDPVLNKQPATFHATSVVVSDNEKSTVLTADITEEEKIEAEMARMNRTLKKGGHQL